MNRTFYGQLLAHHGARAAAWHAALRTANKLLPLEIYRGLVVTMETINRPLLAQKNGRFLKPSELKQFAKNPENDLDDQQVRAATSRGDQCYAFVEGDTLSSYDWYAMYSPAVVGPATVHFSSSYAFRYAGFTHPHFRHDNLQAIGMAKALEALSHDGKKGLVTQVRFSDFDSYASCRRVGFRLFGHALLVKLGGRLLAHATAGCRSYRFRIGSETDAPAGIRVAERGTIHLDPRTI
jgi:hypothetical protein